ncbi:hypothetical protein LCGC14_0415680 [marine sediment metagenome]|uniref:Uncharacterized protein n=1 Tax=marine sediment metagenome TaxID=412755 RepID=A0A0F9TAD3_9ZZZZ
MTAYQKLLKILEMLGKEDSVLSKLTEDECVGVIYTLSLTVDDAIADA